MLYDRREASVDQALCAPTQKLLTGCLISVSRRRLKVSTLPQEAEALHAVRQGVLLKIQGTLKPQMSPNPKACEGHGLLPWRGVDWYGARSMGLTRIHQGCNQCHGYTGLPLAIKRLCTTLVFSLPLPGMSTRNHMGGSLQARKHFRADISRTTWTSFECGASMLSQHRTHEFARGLLSP